MKIVKKIICIIIISFLIVLLGFNIFNIINLKILKKDLTTIGGYGILEVVSGSMEPTIHVGDLIVINTKEQDYKKDDIVTFYDVNGSFVTHRIVDINDSVMVTKGDNNNTQDEELPIDNIVGKYIFKVNGLGKLIAALKNPFTSILIFIIGILICVLISTDKKGNPILDEEEKEFQEFLENKNKVDKKEVINQKNNIFEKLKEKFKKKKKDKPKKKKVKKRKKRVKPKKNKHKKKKK